MVNLESIEYFAFDRVLLVIMVPSFLRNYQQKDFLFLVHFGPIGPHSDHVVPVHSVWRCTKMFYTMLTFLPVTMYIPNVPKS